MSDLHRCDQADYLRQIDGRLTEMETTLFGAERNGGGFIKETRDTMLVVLAFGSRIDALSQQIKELASKKGGIREILKVVLPPCVVGLMAILLWWLSR